MGKDQYREDLKNIKKRYIWSDCGILKLAGIMHSMASSNSRENNKYSYSLYLTCVKEKGARNICRNKMPKKMHYHQKATHEEHLPT